MTQSDKKIHAEMTKIKKWFSSRHLSL